MNLSTTRLKLTAEAPIDLHLHTIHSDGDWTPEQLFDYLAGERFSLAAITDHECTDTAAALQQMAVDKGLPVVVGVEMLTRWRHGGVDLLCLGYDPEQNALAPLTHDLLRRQRENTRSAYESLRQKGQLPDLEQDMAALLARPAAQQPIAFVQLIMSGAGVGEDAAWDLAVAAGSRFMSSDPAAVVEAAHQSGAVCLIAHPGCAEGFVTFDEPLLEAFRAEFPVDGLEVYHPKNSPEQTSLYLAYAQRQGLLVSAGSDSHHPRKPPIKYRAELCRVLLERLGIEVG